MSKNLNKEFKEKVKSFQEEVDVYLKAAREEILKAEKLSNERGLPFKSNIYSWVKAWYVPKSFNKKNGIEEDEEQSDLLELVDICMPPYCEDQDLQGWECEYWSYSSMSC